MEFTQKRGDQRVVRASAGDIGKHNAGRAGGSGQLSEGGGVKRMGKGPGNRALQLWEHRNLPGGDKGAAHAGRKLKFDFRFAIGHTK
jgi:hypothetical protein